MRYRALQLGVVVIGLALPFVIQAAQIDLVYPRLDKGDSVYVYLDTVRTSFLFGSISPTSARLEVNGQEVETTSKGAFLAYVPLDTLPGTKSFQLTLIEEGRVAAVAALPYRFVREMEKPVPDTIARGALVFPLALRVTAEHAVTRTAPDGTYDLFPPLGTNLVASGFKGEFFRLDLGGGEVTYIEDRFVAIDSSAALEPSIVEDIIVVSSPEESRVTIPLSARRAFRAQLSMNLRVLTVSFYNSASKIDKITSAPWEGGVDLMRWRRGGGNRVDLDIRCREPLEHGYSVRYLPDASVAEVFIRHCPSGRRGSLRGKTIVVDPGHGGEADGSIGPLRTLEKDAVLVLGKLLKDELERRGARVLLTRESDVTVSIYDRVDFAREQEADFLISVHANALHDGDNPFLRHGSGTYYYHPGSRRAAETIHRRLLRATKLRDDGIFYDDLALVRPTEFPAVLVEVAYMMYPDEEELLRDSKFLKRVARGLAKGLHDYFRMR
jgi:N-acetylmuramoyl-L-alanine amidase